MILYETNEREFKNNGLGHISDSLYCLETKQKSLNGWYIDVELPISYSDMILEGRILFVETKEKNGQPFRIKNIEKTSKKIKLIANHVVFDAANYLLVDVRPNDLSPVAFLNWLNDRTDEASPFKTTSNVSGSATKYFIRTTLFDAFVETESIFGGIYDIDKFKVSLLSQVGNDDGYSLIYGKNIQNAKIIEDWSYVCTKLYPVGPDELMLPEEFIKSELQYEKLYTKTIDFNFDTSYKNDDGETIEYTLSEKQQKLRELAQNYIISNSLPLIYYEVNSDINETLRIGDIIHVKHPVFSVKTEVQAYSYDCLSRKVKSIEFGNYRPNAQKTFSDLKTTVTEAVKKADDSITLTNKQTELINNLNKNGLVYIDDNEILILDKLPKSEAIDVWRFGLGGIGFSSNGYKGPYNYAFTSDGSFNTDFIRANSITANMLSSDVGSSLNLESNIAITAQISDINQLKIDMNGLSNTLLNTGGNNLIRDSIGLFNDNSWIGEITQDTNINLNDKNLYGASLLISSNIKQDIKVVNGAYTLKFDYVKYVSLANTRVKLNDMIFILDSSDINSFTTQFNVDSNMVSIEFLSDTVGAIGITNVMLNQGTEAQIWSLNSNETFTDTVKIGRGVTIGATGSNVTFEAQADIIGFKNKSDIYTATFDENGASMNEIIVKNKGVITGCLFQEINNQTTINYIGGDN